MKKSDFLMIAAGLVAVIGWGSLCILLMFIGAGIVKI